MFAVGECELPETGGSMFVVIAGLFVLVAGVIVTRWGASVCWPVVGGGGPVGVAGWFRVGAASG